MIQAVKVGRGGTIEAHFLGGRPVSATVSVYTSDGTAKVSGGTAVLESVNTTLASSAEAGDRTVALTSGTGVVVGRRYLIGVTNGSEVPEAVTVKSVSGGTATIWAPLMHDHSSGAAFAGTRASYAMGAGEADEVWSDGYAEWTPASGEVVTEVVECAKRPVPKYLIDETDIRLVWADAAANLPASLDMPMALLEARDEFLRRFGAKNRVHWALGSDHFRRVCSLIFWLLRRYELGPDYEARMVVMAEEVSTILGELVSQIVWDNDQDGATDNAVDGGFPTLGLANR